MAVLQLRADRADCSAYLAGLVPPVVDAQGRSQQGAEAAGAEEPLARELLVRHVQKRFLLGAQRGYQQEALAVVIVHGSCPGRKAVLSNQVPPLVQDAHYEDQLVHHRVVWQSAGHQVESAPGDLGDLRVLVAIIPLVEARVDPVPDVHESTRHGLGAFGDLVVGHLVLLGARDPRLVSHGSHRVEDANAHVGLATQVLVGLDRRDMEGHGTIHREVV